MDTNIPAPIQVESIAVHVLYLYIIQGCTVLVVTIDYDVSQHIMYLDADTINRSVCITNDVWWYM